MSKKAAAEQKKDVKQCLKLLEAGKLQLEDVECFADEIKSRPEIGDKIQYELHKYCKRDVLKTNTNLIVKLSELCYTNESVSCFSDISRFVGCVFSISSHLLKKERYQSAVDLVSILSIRKNEIMECSKEKPDIQSSMCILHSNLIASALSLTSKVKSLSDDTYQLCHRLSIESLNVFKLTTSEQPDMGKKVLKTTTLYLQSLKHYKEEDIGEFYQTLREVLKILIPILGTLDYFWYFLGRVYQMKKPDSDAEVEQIMRKVVDLLMIFHNSSAAVRDVFVKIVDFFWVDFNEEKWISNEELKLLTENPSHIYLNFLLVSTIFNYGVKFLWAQKSWVTNVSVAAVEKMSNTLMAFHKSVSGCPGFYCSPYRPFEACNGDLITGNLHKIQYTIRLCLKNRLPDAVNLAPVSRMAFKLGLDCLEDFKCDCFKKLRKDSWKSSVIHHTNTVEDLHRLEPSDESWLFLMEISREVVQKIVSSGIEIPFDFARLKIVFERWHTACLKLENYQQALFACVTYYVSYPKEETDIMSMWIHTKSASSNEIIQEITVADMLKRSDNNLREFSKAYKSSNVCYKSVLLMELKAYGTCPPVPFQNPNTIFMLATRIWKKLQNVKLDLWESSVAMSSLILASLSGEIDKLPNGFHEEYQKLIDTFMNQRNTEKLQCRSLLHAANLSFALFLYNMRTSETSEAKLDTTQEVLNYLKKEEEKKVKLGEDVDLNLSCDVIPSSRNLTVELETKYSNELNRFVDLWGDALKQSANGLPPAPECDTWLRNVKHVANMYEIFGEYRSALTTWLMYYRIGKCTNDSGAALLGLSHLIKNCSDVDASGMKAEAEVMSEGIANACFFAEKKVLVEYLLAMATNYLKNKKAKECLERLTLAKKILKSLPMALKTYTLHAKFWCVTGQFLMVYEEYAIVFDYPVDMAVDVRVLASRAFRFATRGIKSELIKTTTQPESTEHVLTLLEVSLWAYHVYAVYRQTDDMRGVLEGVYQIVQRLFLPTRTAELLARLAEADIICEKAPDCQEKVNKLKSILTTWSSIGSETVKSKKSNPYLKVPQQGEFDSTSTPTISPIRLMGNKTPQPKDLDVSPIQQYLKEAQTPKTSEHEMKCNCRLCQNLLVQTLTMQTAWLEAEIHRLKNGKKRAMDCYVQACEMLNRLEHLVAEQGEILRLELTSALKEDPGEMDLMLRFVQFHAARFLICFARFESTSTESVTQNVGKMIQRVSKLLNNMSYEQKLLRWTFTELKLVCVYLIDKTTKTPMRRTPESVEKVTPTVTPLAPASELRTPVIAKSGSKEKKSPRPSASTEQMSSSVVMNTAFIEMDNTKTLPKLLRPRKLNFNTNETEMVTKNTKDSAASITSRKLDFDLSSDLFEETVIPARTAKTTAATTKKPAATTKKPAATTKKPSATTKKPAAISSETTKPKKKNAADSVKIYVDPKNDGKTSKKGETKKPGSAKPRKDDKK